jgi:hypothetical protein
MQALAPLLDLLSSDSPQERQTAIMMIDSFYESLVGKYRPLVEIAPHLVGKAAEDLVPLLTNLLKIAVESFTEMAADEGLKDALKAFTKVMAEGQYKRMQAYIDAGFERSEAFSLLIKENERFDQIKKNVRIPGASRSK